MSLESAYDAKTFEWYAEFKGDYFQIAGALIAGSFNGDVLDIGCGAGYIIEAIHSMHPSIGVKAVEGVSGCIGVMHADIRKSLTILDVSKPFYLGNKYDLVICLEVGEHLAPEASDTLINNIFNHVHPTRYVYFSAATPGQGGHMHLNEQPHSYWISKFNARGFEFRKEDTADMREAAGKTRLSWLRDNGMIFRRLV